MIGVITSVFIGLSIQHVRTTDSSTTPKNPFVSSNSTRNAKETPSKDHFYLDDDISSDNNWGFSSEETEWPDSAEATTRNTPTKMITSTSYYDEVDPDRNGALKGIGSINVGFGVGVGIPHNDPVRVGTRLGIGFGESGLAGKLPIGQDIFPMQLKYLTCRSAKVKDGGYHCVPPKSNLGRLHSLNDYDGDKANIVADRARKYWIAVSEGRIRIPHYRPAPSLVDLGGQINIGNVRPPL